MTDNKPMTVKQVGELTQMVRQELNEIRQRLDDNAAAKTMNAPPKPEYTEADALKRCITALDGLPKRSNDMSSPGIYAGGNLDYVKRSDVRRILMHLASRFGIDLVEIRDQPCSRGHINPQAQQQLQDAIYNFNANISSDGAA